MRSVRSPSRSSAAVETGAELSVRCVDADLQRNAVRDDAGRGMIGRQAVVQEHGAECNGNGQKQGDQGDL